ncbi:helix-turn-helix domain-containing protein [Actinomadura sp. NPDC048032]
MLGDHPAVVGLAVAVTRAALSLRLARCGLDLLPPAMLARGTPVHVSEQIPALLLVQNHDLAQRLVDRKLAPLRRLRPAQHDRLAKTLLAYFECGFNASTTAARLHTHPQTVRNRLRLLERLFGPELYAPASVLGYLMALHAWHSSPTGRKPAPGRDRRILSRCANHDARVILSFMAQYSPELDGVFVALADPTRRAVVRRLGLGPTSVGDLAREFPMTLPSFMKHVRTLESNGLIRTLKSGRVRTCVLNRERLDLVDDWLAEQRRIWEGRTDRLEQFVTDPKEEGR